MAGVYHLFVYMQTAQKNTPVCVYTTTGALHAPVVVYIDIVVYLDSLHIHEEMVYTSHFHIFLSQNPVVVCIYI